MKEYISREYINNLLTRHLDNWWGPEYYACRIIQDEIDDAPETEIIRMYECSICGEMNTEPYRFCLCCGKPMNGDENNEN
jgi:hypothetical protein